MPDADRLPSRFVAVDRPTHAPEVKLASVPSLLLQQLVENAIRQGISKRSSGGTVVVSAERVENRLEIHVLDDGVGLPRQWSLENSAGEGPQLPCGC